MFYIYVDDFSKKYSCKHISNTDWVIVSSAPYNWSQISKERSALRQGCDADHISLVQTADVIFGDVSLCNFALK